MYLYTYILLSFFFFFEKLYFIYWNIYPFKVILFLNENKEKKRYNLKKEGKLFSKKKNKCM